MPDESTLWALEDARRRGVRVRMVVEGDITDAMPVKYASRHFYDRLLSDGVEMFEYQPTMMHTKTLVVDGIWSMFGSANFDNRSLELNDELNVAVSSRELAARLLQDFEKDVARLTQARTQHLARAIVPDEDARALLERVLRSLLELASSLQLPAFS